MPCRPRASCSAFSKPLANLPPQAEAALASYQQALEAPDLSPSSGVEGAAERRALCGAGLARCSILAGDVERGVELAAAAGAPGLLLQCAELLEAQGQAKQVRARNAGWIAGSLAGWRNDCPPLLDAA